MRPRVSAAISCRVSGGRSGARLARNRRAASARAFGGSSGRVCSRRWISRPRRKRMSSLPRSGASTPGSSASREGESGRWGKGSGGGGKANQPSWGAATGLRARGGGRHRAEGRRSGAGPGPAPRRPSPPSPSSGPLSKGTATATSAEPIADQLIPGPLGGLVHAPPAADIEPVLGPGEGDIEQAPLLLGDLALEDGRAPRRPDPHRHRPGATRAAARSRLGAPRASARPGSGDRAYPAGTRWAPAAPWRHAPS